MEEKDIVQLEEGQEGELLREQILAKKSFSKVGWSFFAFMVVSIFCQAILTVTVKVVVKQTGMTIESKFWNGVLDFGLTLLPMYLFGIPILRAMLKPLPRAEISKGNFSKGRLFQCFLISITMMTIGNLVATGLVGIVEVITGKSATNNLAEIIGMTDPFVNFIFVVLIGPLLEEVVFRKIIIDRTVRFGERNAMILSGVMFGLFHMNLYQFFYATALGMIFAYVYIRSGKLLYTYILHAAINFLGSIVAVFIATAAEGDTLTLIQQGQFDQVSQKALWIMTGVVLYGFLYTVMIFSGLILMFLKRNKAVLDVEGEPFDRRASKGLIYGNYGMAFFIALCIVMMGVTMLAQLS